MTVQITDEQRAILDYVKAGHGDLLIDALAGSGKTFALLESIKVIPQQSILLCAFSKPIQIELEGKKPVLPRTKALHVKTFHSLGLAIVKRHYPHLEVNDKATEEIINQLAAKGTPFQSRRAMVSLLRFAKQSFAELEPDEVQLEVLGHEHHLFDKFKKDQDIKTVVFTVCRAYNESRKIEKRSTIDFGDMVWLPAVLKLAPPARYQAILVDELQDVTTVQWELINALRAVGGRLICVGDRRQHLYQFAGADLTAWRCFLTMTPKKLRLTTTFRCAKTVVTRANEIVPELRARHDAPQGEERTIALADLAQLIQHDETQERAYDLMTPTFVLSRNNVDLLRVAMKLWQARTSFRLNAGKEIIEPLFDVIDKLDIRGRPVFTSSLVTWRLTELAKAEAAHAVAWADRIEEQFAILALVAGYVEPGFIKQTLIDIMGLGDRAPSGCTLSTVHKAKGLEATRVFLLRETFARYQDRQDAEGNPLPIDEADLWIEYVAITRARESLTWVNIK